MLVATREHHIPDAAPGLLTEGRREYASFGPSRLSSLAPVTPETLLQVGSLSKTFTATAVWHLIDRGALTVDAPDRTNLLDPTVANAAMAARVTIAHLERV